MDKSNDDKENPKRDDKRSFRRKAHRFFKRWWPVLAVLAVLLIIPLGIDRYVVWSTRGQLRTDEEMQGQTVDAILVLGAYVREDGSLCDMLEDRMNVGIRLYQAGISDTLLLSGDGQSDDYDETEAMKQYALDRGVPEEAIVLDKAGLSTYASVHRAGKTGGYQSLVIVTQRYHLYRSLYIADALDIPAVGVSADLRSYWNQIKYDLREILARNKDFFQCWQLPVPSHAQDALLYSENSGNTKN